MFWATSLISQSRPTCRPVGSSKLCQPNNWLSLKLVPSLDIVQSTWIVPKNLSSLIDFQMPYWFHADVVLSHKFPKDQVVHSLHFFPTQLSNWSQVNVLASLKVSQVVHLWQTCQPNDFSNLKMFPSQSCAVSIQFSQKDTLSSPLKTCQPYDLSTHTLFPSQFCAVSQLFSYCAKLMLCFVLNSVKAHVVQSPQNLLI